MSASLAPSPLISQQDTTGSPLVGGQLFVYLTGSQTPTPTFTDASGSTPNPNPVILNDYGQAQVWLSAAVTYRFQMALPGDGDAVTPPTDPIWTVDNISVTSGVTSIGGVGGAITLGAGLSIVGQMLSATVYRDYISGLGLSAAGSTSTFGVAPGLAVDSTNAAIMSLSVSLNKTTSAFSPGTGNGALDTGAISASSWYNTFLIENPTTGAVDVLISKAVSGSVPAPTLPAGYTLYRRIGSMLTDGSSNWVAFTQVGDRFLWTAPPLDVNHSITTTTPTLNTLASIPLGVAVSALLVANCSVGAGATEYCTLSAPYTGGLSAIVSYAQLTWSNTLGTVGCAAVQVDTNAAQQVYVAVSSASSTTITIGTQGWIDTRGRNA